MLGENEKKTIHGFDSPEILRRHVKWKMLGWRPSFLASCTIFMATLGPSWHRFRAVVRWISLAHNSQQDDPKQASWHLWPRAGANRVARKPPPLQEWTYASKAAKTGAVPDVRGAFSVMRSWASCQMPKTSAAFLASENRRLYSRSRSSAAGTSLKVTA